MKKYRPYREFTAHGQNLSTLKTLYRIYKESDCKSGFIEPIVVFMAFSIEAYMNHLGAENISIWSDLERLPWKSKINILYKITGNEPDWGRKPLQFARKVFTYRDKLAHGKPELVYGPVCTTDEEAYYKLRELDLFIPEWYQNIDGKWIMEAESHLDELITHLGDMFGRAKNDQAVLAYTGVEEINEQA